MEGENPPDEGGGAVENPGDADPKLTSNTTINESSPTAAYTGIGTPVITKTPDGKPSTSLTESVRRFRYQYEDMRVKYKELKKDCDMQMQEFESTIKEKDATIKDLTERCEK